MMSSVDDTSSTLRNIALLQQKLNEQLVAERAEKEYWKKKAESLGKGSSSVEGL